ncbi:hypothetical protein FNV43_RR04146 [Rhamnella rubrinervis]|uniref:Pentatricopeptide repeat-containing protein n=1 Tax=Rhamnella rubrinervis TaxID=2594499 RepID=A0A8K0HL65_9ROSA|nr:hypothetical protein FNV43_RR04146 [Rhamnella rubrinervis]
MNLLVFETLSHQCRDFKEFKQMLSQMVLTGFIKDAFAAKRLLQFSTRNLAFIHVDYCYQIFNFIENPDASFYNIMMMAYVWRKYVHRAIPLYKLMLHRNVGPNVYTYPFLVEACVVRESDFEGGQLHNHVLKLGFDSDVDVRSTFVDMYADCRNYEDACKVFKEGPMMDSFVWYSLLEECIRSIEGLDEMGDIYNLMPEKDTRASTYRIVNLWYWGEFKKCKQLINEIPENDTVSLSMLINCYAAQHNEKYEQALDLFITKHGNGIMLDELVVQAVVSCCTSLARLDRDMRMTGKLIHNLVVKIGVECDVELQNSMICMYSECGDVLSAQNLFNAACWLDECSWFHMLGNYMICGLDEKVEALFESMPEKDVDSCIRMISYYSERVCFSEGLALFHKIVGSSVRLDDEHLRQITMELPVRFVAVDLGKCIHGYAIKNGYCLSGSRSTYGYCRDDLKNALWHMYKRRCGYKHSDERGFY